MPENRTASNGTAMPGKDSATPGAGATAPGSNSAFHNLRPEVKRLHLLVKPTGWTSGMAMDNPGFQMKHSVKLLEQELAETGEPRVLQLFLRGADSRDPDAWELYADGVMVASGTGAFARECFEESATRFLDLCREAVAQNAQESFGQDGYEMLLAAQRIAGVEARTVAREEAWLTATAALHG